MSGPRYSSIGPRRLRIGPAGRQDMAGRRDESRNKPSVLSMPRMRMQLISLQNSRRAATHFQTSKDRTSCCVCMCVSWFGCWLGQLCMGEKSLFDILRQSCKLFTLNVTVKYGPARLGGPSHRLGRLLTVSDGKQFTSCAPYHGCCTSVMSAQ